MIVPTIINLFGLYLIIKSIFGIYHARKASHQQREMAQMTLDSRTIDPLPLGTDINLENHRLDEDWHDSRRSYPEFYILPVSKTILGIVLLLISWQLW